MADERTGGPYGSAALRLELFVDDLHASLDFYRRVPGSSRVGAEPVTMSPRAGVGPGYGAELADPDGYLIRLWDQRSMKEK